MTRSDLKRRFDGPIPQHLVRAAEGYDERWALLRQAKMLRNLIMDYLYFLRHTDDFDKIAYFQANVVWFRAERYRLLRLAREIEA